MVAPALVRVHFAIAHASMHACEAHVVMRISCAHVAGLSNHACGWTGSSGQLE